MTAFLALLRNPWVLLAIAIVAGLGGTGWYRMRWMGEVADRAKDVAEARDKLLKQQAEDAEYTRGLSDQLAAELAAKKEQTNVRSLAIARAPVTDGCANSPAMRALFDGLRHRPDETGAGQSPGAGRTGAALPR